MINELDKDLLAILIIRKKVFANAYQLCKVLAWKFDVINCSEIISRLESKKYVTISFPTSPTLKYFDLTLEGRKFLHNDLTHLYEIVKSIFPNEKKFIDDIFKEI